MQTLNWSKKISSHFADFEQVKKISSHFEDFDQVKEISSHFKDLEQVKKLEVILLTFNNNYRLMNFFDYTYFLYYIKKII